MGKKPVLGIVSALCVGLALTGCRNCSSCQSDNTRVTKTNPAAFKPQPTFQTNSAAAAPSAQGWNNSATTPKPTISAPVDTSTPFGMDKPVKPADPLATSKPTAPSVQPTAFATPPAASSAPMPAPTPTPMDEAAPVDSNTSHFAPTGAGRILPSPPTLAPTTSLPPLREEHPAPRKTEDSSALPLPPPPPLPSMAPPPANDAPALPKETLSPSALPAPSLEPGTLPPLPPPPVPPGPNG
jgi:hypothetical protein